MKTPTKTPDVSLSAAASVPEKKGVASARKKTVLPETTEGMPWPSNHEIKKESNPFTDRDWRMLMYAWTGLFVRVFIIFGGIFTVFQYLANREETRIERTLALVELWEQAQNQQAQQALKVRLAGLNEKYATLLGQNPSAAETALYFERIGIEAMKPEGGSQPLPEFQAEFDRVVYFLNRLSFCVEGNLCSREVADAYFRDYAVSFWSYFSGYIAEQRREGARTFALPIESYIRSGQTPSEAK